jgi:hypothetical protein
MYEYADVQMKFNIDIENLNLKLRFFLWRWNYLESRFLILNSCLFDS